MKTWTEKVREDARSIQNELEKTFIDGKDRYTFFFADIDAFSHGSASPDFELFADVFIVRNSGQPDYSTEHVSRQAMGDSLHPESREKIPFGKEYYDAVHYRLYEIVENRLRENNEEIAQIIKRFVRRHG